MTRYHLDFSKEGYAIYTSHLDMQRLFKRAFKRAGIEIAYSQGYNPHPLMSFAQPLSLGYSSVAEILEFKTKEDYEPADIASRVNEVMPEGIAVLGCSRMEEGTKTLASRCTAAIYEIKIPAGETSDRVSIDDFLAQESIIVKKRNKKKKIVEVDIKEKIQSIDIDMVDNNIILKTKLDAGSDSNLSPELLITAFLEFFNIPTDRSNIEVSRLELICK